MSTKRRIEVFRPGTFTAMDGRSYAFSAEDVAAIAAGYDADAAPAPVVVGHPSHDDPAFGWASAFEVDEKGVLVAELDRLAPAFVSAVSEGRYRKVSMKFFSPDAPNNPRPGSYYPRHVGFLGGAAPAVSGLAPVEFAGDDEGCFEIALASQEVAFGSTKWGFKEIARVFRSLRDWLIEKEGVEAANKIVDSWGIDWIDDAGDDEPEVQPAYAAPVPAPSLNDTPITFADGETPAAPKSSKLETAMTGTTLAAREKRLAERERALAEQENTAFADKMVAEGHVAAGSRDRLVGLLAAIPADAPSVSFAEGDATTDASPRDLLSDLLRSTPAQLPEGQAVTGDDVPAQRGPSFAAPDGYAIDPGSLELFHAARRHQAAHPEMSFADAAIAVQNMEA